MTEALARTPLHDLHGRLGARMVPFAGYEMPVQYPSGIMAERNWTRSSAGLFDVSHMGQAFLVGSDHATTAAASEKLVPGEVLGLGLSRIRYTQLTTPEGGFSPTINAPIAMGYVESAHAALGTALTLAVPDRELPANVAAILFVPHNYKR